MRQKARETAKKQATEDNQNVKEKKPTRTGHGNTQENTRYTWPEFSTRARPPEKDTTTTQDAPNEEYDYGQPGTSLNNKQNRQKEGRLDRKVKGDANKVFGENPQKNGPHTQVQPQDTKGPQQHTRSTSNKTTGTLARAGSTHQEHASVKHI